MNILQAVLILLPLQFLFDQNSNVSADTALHIWAANPAWAKAEVAAGTYDVAVEAWGDAGPAGWPNVALARSRGGIAQANLTFGSAQRQEYKTRMVFSSDSPTIYLSMTNDSYDSVTKKDTNAHIKKITFSRIDVDSVTVSWDANTESDLAGYRVYHGYASRLYDKIFDVGNATAYPLVLEKGVEHFLAVTAYDNSANESGYSNEVVWSMPLILPPTAKIISPTAGQVLISKTLHVSVEIGGDYTKVSYAIIFFGMNGQWIFPVSGNKIEQDIVFDEADGVHQLTVQIIGMEGDFQVILHTAVVAVKVQIPDTTPPGPVRNFKIIKK